MACQSFAYGVGKGAKEFQFMEVFDTWAVEGSPLLAIFDGSFSRGQSQGVIFKGSFSSGRFQGAIFIVIFNGSFPTL